MTIGALVAAGGLASAAAMALVAWGLPSFEMVGPRPGSRIAALMPQVEVATLFLVALPLWAQGVAAPHVERYRRALAVTAHGPSRAVAAAATARGRVLLAALGGDALVWLFVIRLDGGPTLAHVLAVRALLLAFALFALGVAAWTSAAFGGARAMGVASVVALAMAVAPLAVAPVVGTFGAQPAVIQAVMLGCPWIVAAGVAGFDLVRAEWLYALSPLGSVDASYPGLAPALAVYGGVGVLLLALATRTTRRLGMRLA